jgi:hypothetical protein
VARTSLRDELIDLRCRYTGERRGEAASAIARVTATMPARQRDAVVWVLRADETAWADVPATHGVELERLRPLLMPDAVTLDQQVLEISVLLAAVRAVNHLHHRPPASFLRPAHALRAVYPGRGSGMGLALRLDGPHALGPLLFELLPTVNEVKVAGVTGLRPRRSGGSLVLGILDKPASIIIRDVTKQTWESAVAFLEEALVGMPQKEWLWRRSPDRLTTEEARHRAEFPRPPWSVGLASAFARRHLLLSKTCWIEVWQRGTGGKVAYTGGPAPFAIATGLLHPLFGLPGQFKLEDNSVDTICMTAIDPPEEAAPTLLRPIELVLHREPMASLEGESELWRNAERNFSRMGWDAWTRTSAGAPSPTKNQRAAVRAAYTGESLPAARCGLGADGSTGLDHCSEPQRQLRALLALHVFNAGRRGMEPPVNTRISTITCYRMTLSPRFDDLVIFTDSPDNLTGYFVRDRPHRGLPGMRLEAHNGRTFRLRHLPTDARLTITSRGEGDWRADCRGQQDWTRIWCGTDVPMTETEQENLNALPPISADAARLMSALLVRMTVADRNGGWAVGTWDWDPLDRPILDSQLWLRTERQLWGSSDWWELRWSGYPFAFDVGASILDPTIGLPDVILQRNGATYTASLGKATIRLHAETLGPAGNRGHRAGAHR